MKHRIVKLFGFVVFCCFTMGVSAVDLNYASSTVFESTPVQPVTTDNMTGVATYGPIAPFLGVAEITFIDGPQWKTFIISYLLESRNLHFLIPVLQVDIEDLTFSIRYSMNIPDSPVLRNFAYSTAVAEDENPVFYNESHTVIITGFDGMFLLTRAKPLQFSPANFLFAGVCDDVLILT